MLTRKYVRKSLKFYDKELLKIAFIKSFEKLNPKTLVKNPVMFTVEIGTLINLIVSLSLIINLDPNEGSFIYNFAITVILFITLLFANFAEAIAEAQGKAQADTLRKTREDTPAKILLHDGEVVNVSSSELKKGDQFIVDTGDMIPMDGDIVEGIASIDESAITGESAPVIRESGGDRSSVTGGTKVLSGRIVVIVTSEKGETFLDKMIILIEGAVRKKTPNEIALTLLLSGFTLVFLIVTVTLYYFGLYSGTLIPISSLIALFVCLIPTTIGSLLSAIGVAGISRALKANIIAKSGKAIETSGDIDTLLLDKTGTITIGNRKATNFIKLSDRISEEEFVKMCALSSIGDDTPEGKSIIEVAVKLGFKTDKNQYKDAKVIKFHPQTRISGVDIENNIFIRKGSIDAIKNLVILSGNSISENYQENADRIGNDGGTPLMVALNNEAIGLIQLEDVIKEGVDIRFRRLRLMGVKTVMVTGDNKLTAKYIANKVNVDDYIAEAKPEDKLSYIRAEQAQGKLVAMMGDGTNDAPALAQADVGVAMNAGTQTAKEACNMVDLDNDPTKLIEIVEIGKQLLITRGALTTFSIANDVAKYFAIIPAVFMSAIPQLQLLNIMGLSSPQSAILSAVIFNAIIIPLLIPLAIKGVKYRPIGASKILTKNLVNYGLGGIIIPFLGIKLIDMIISIFKI